MSSWQRAISRLVILGLLMIGSLILTPSKAQAVDICLQNYNLCISTCREYPLYIRVVCNESCFSEYQECIAP
jgi:hypothetical protein